MKIILGIEDIKKLIKESYNGVNEVDIKAKDLEFVLDVDGDTFSKISKNNNISKQQPTKLPPLNQGVDFDALLAEREVTQTESIIPAVKTLDEKNAEAASKGLMTSGRGSSRPVRKF